MRLDEETPDQIKAISIYDFEIVDKLVKDCLMENPEFLNYRYFLRDCFERGCSLQEAVDVIRNEIALHEEDERMRKETRESEEVEAKINELVERCLKQNPDLIDYKYCLKHCLSIKGNGMQKAIKEAYLERATDQEMEKMRKEIEEKKQLKGDVDVLLEKYLEEYPDFYRNCLMECLEEGRSTQEAINDAHKRRTQWIKVA